MIRLIRALIELHQDYFANLADILFPNRGRTRTPRPTLLLLLIIVALNVVLVLR